MHALMRLLFAYVFWLGYMLVPDWSRKSLSRQVDPTALSSKELTSKQHGYHDGK
jgi:hypothetical protein